MIAPRLLTSRSVLRLIDRDDAQRLLRFRVENREHLAPWEPLREAWYFTQEQCLQYIGEAREAIRLDRAYPFLILDPAEEHILGTFTFSNVVRGAFQACHLGYAMGASNEGRGLMKESLVEGLAWAFGSLGLHRVMANYIPRNERSAGLLRALGFEREGLARAYLLIAGRWEDHVLTALIRPD